MRPFVHSCILFVSGCLLLVSCQGNYTPKPRGYFRIDLPEKKYREYRGDCPFSFECPVYSEIENDRSRNAQPCWINVDYKQFKAKLHLSYKSVKEASLNSLIEDSRMLVYKHTAKADAINETLIKNRNHVSGMFYDLQGSTASSVQFYLTDSTTHFLRASLYFYSEPQPDSLAPVLDFLRKDVSHMIDSFRWTGK